MSSSINTEVLGLIRHKREYLLISGADETVTIAFDGMEYVIPDQNTIKFPHPKFADVPFSGKDSLGEWIPGSLVLSDLEGQRGMCDGRNDGGVWQAGSAIVAALGIDRQSGVASGPTFKKGISLLPMNPTPDQIALTREEAQERYLSWKIDWANQFLKYIEDRSAKRQSLGLSTLGVGPDELRERNLANKILAKAGALLTPPPSPVQEEEISMEGFAEQVAKELATAQVVKAPELDLDALVKNLMSNGAFREAARKNYRIRKNRKRNGEVAEA